MKVSCMPDKELQIMILKKPNEVQDNADRNSMTSGR